MRRAAAGLLVAVLALLSYPGADLAALHARLRRSPAALDSGGAPLPWLHVEHPPRGTAFIADPEGRRVILRGVVAGGLMDFWSGSDPADESPPPLFPIDPAAYEQGRCPANFATIRVPPLCRNDLAEMRQLGFNVLRLALSWSLLEPRPGGYDQTYLDRVAQVVGWARAEGVYVMLDMHENAYSRYVGRPARASLPGADLPTLYYYTGAPRWATITDGLPSQNFIGQREINPAVGAAFTNFWLNRAGLQDHYIGALAALGRRFREDSAVVGYGVFNEPWPGFFDLPWFEDLFLFPFYRRVIDALAGAGDGLPCPSGWPAVAPCGYPDLGVHDRRHLFFVEADHLRELTDFATDLPQPLSSYPNVVYAIHAYTHKFTLDAMLGQKPETASYPPGGYDLSYRSAGAEARSLGAALFVSEYGYEPNEDPLLSRQLEAQDRHQVGSTFWPWKENCSATRTWGVYASVFGESGDQRCASDRPAAAADATPKPQNGCLRASRERLLARVWPRAAAGTVISFAYDPATGAFRLRGHSPDASRATQVYIPAEVTGEVVVSSNGWATTEKDRGGGRLVSVSAQGDYEVRVTPAPLHLRGCA